jgi:tetratricopeptide (TPR) repeat protein
MESDDKEKNATILSNIAQCYIKLHLYEDALEYSNKALRVIFFHNISLLRKARALTYLFRFDEAIEILKTIVNDYPHERENFMR